MKIEHHIPHMHNTKAKKMMDKHGAVYNDEYREFTVTTDRGDIRVTARTQIEAEEIAKKDGHVVLSTTHDEA